MSFDRGWPFWTFSTWLRKKSMARNIMAKGSVQSLTVDEAAAGTTVSVLSGAAVKTLNLDTGTTVTGKGDVDQMNVNTSGTKTEMLPDTIAVRPGINANINGQVMRKNFFHRGLSLLLAALLSVSLVLPAAADDPPDLSGITVSLGGSAEMILDKSSLTMYATVSNAPENAVLTYAWSSSNTSAAWVSSSSDATATINRGVTPGRATISVVVTAKSATDGSTISVTQPANRDVLLPGVTLSSSSFSLKTRETKQLTATLHVRFFQKKRSPY